mmetsp:Transcript_13457/g.32889  ORF Transcript_13457/g.32889 Transcript_13457/m.32889 type:complete len:234 (+) Transcript_13457:102-803(+)
MAPAPLKRQQQTALETAEGPRRAQRLSARPSRPCPAIRTPGREQLLLLWLQATRRGVELKTVAWKQQLMRPETTVTRAAHQWASLRRSATVCRGAQTPARRQLQTRPFLLQRQHRGGTQQSRGEGMNRWATPQIAQQVRAARGAKAPSRRGGRFPARTSNCLLRAALLSPDWFLALLQVMQHLLLRQIRCGVLSKAKPGNVQHPVLDRGAHLRLAAVDREASWQALLKAGLAI